MSEVFPKVEIHEGYRGSTLAQLLTNTAGIPGEIAPKLWSELWKGEGSAAEQRMTLVRGNGPHPYRDQYDVLRGDLVGSEKRLCGRGDGKSRRERGFPEM